MHSSPVPGTPWVSDAGKQERSMGLESKTHEWTSKLGEPMLATSPPHWCGLSLPRKTESLWKSYDTNLVSRMTPLSVAAHIFINCSRPLSSRWMCSDSGPTTICPQPLESPCCWEVSDMYKPTQSALLSTLLTPTALCHYSNTVVYKLAKKTDGKSWKCVNVWMDEICRQPIATLRPPLRQLSLGAVAVEVTFIASSLASVLGGSAIVPLHPFVRTPVDVNAGWKVAWILHGSENNSRCPSECSLERHVGTWPAHDFHRSDLEFVCKEH